MGTGSDPKLASARHASFVFLALSLQLLASIAPATAQGSSNNNPAYNNYAQFNPSMAVIIAVLIAALFFMAFFSIYIRHCSDATSPSVRVAATVGGGGRSRRAMRGLSPDVIATFPTLVYSDVKGLKIGKGALECAVCLNEFDDDETLRLIPKCDHVFHPECIDAWLASHVTCPVCRANLVPQPGESPYELPELNRPESDQLAGEDEDRRDGDEVERSNTTEHGEQVEVVVEGDDDRRAVTEPEVIDPNKMLNRNRKRGSRSYRTRKLPFPRSHSTGHSLLLVQPGENTDRFTLRLPVEVRKQIVDRQLNRTMSLVALPREGSSRRGYRPMASGADGSSRGRQFSFRLLDRTDGGVKSGRWLFGRVPSFSFFSRASSVRSPRVAAEAQDGGGSLSGRPNRAEAGTSSEPARPPV